MSFTRFVLVAAAAAGATYYLKDRGMLPGLRQRLALGGGMGAAVPAGSPVAETMWTPSDPAVDAAQATTPPAAS